tara:strand:+ start:17146 stop:17934 length:789 start_codon:yes stop_codon:yes gene_type:complete
MIEFSKKTVWITGASSGIGKALAIKFSQLNANVVLSSRKEKELEEVAKKCGGNCMVLPLDLEKQNSFPSNVQTVIKQYKTIDLLINNGGISQRSEASQTSLEVDRRLMEVNYFGTIALTKAVLPIMQSQKSGYIVTVSSLSGKFGFFLRSAYSASKFAQLGFFESLRLEEEKNNIKISMVFPGFVDTNISKNSLSHDGKTHQKQDNNQKNGISPEKCAQDIVNGIIDNKHEIYTGGREIKAITIKRFFPNIFYKIIKKQSST